MAKTGKEEQETLYREYFTGWALTSTGSRLFHDNSPPAIADVLRYSEERECYLFSGGARRVIDLTDDGGATLYFGVGENEGTLYVSKWPGGRVTTKLDFSDVWGACTVNRGVGGVPSPAVFVQGSKRGGWFFLADTTDRALCAAVEINDGIVAWNRNIAKA